MNRLIPLLLLAVFGGELLQAQPSVRFRETPPGDNDVASPIRFTWEADVPGAQFRYKLDAPGDWMGGIGYVLNRWSLWGDAASILFDDFILEGKYTLTVEARARGSERAASRTSNSFRVHFVMPEIESEPTTIAWERVRAAGDNATRYRILAEEYRHAYETSMRRFELESRVLKLTGSRDDFVQKSAELIVNGAQRSLLEWADKGVAATADKILLPETLYQIVKQAGLDAVLIYRNVRTNRAAFAAIANYFAWKGYDALARRTTIESDARTTPQEENFKPARAPKVHAGPIDLIFCIDTTASMAGSIDRVKAASSQIIDGVFGVASSVRLGLVAYRDYGSEYLTKGFPFTTDKEEIRRNVMSLTIGEGGDPPEAVYEALLHAVHTTALGEWRTGARKIIVLMGDAPPHTKAHTVDEVAKAAEEVDPAHVFPILVATSSEETRGAFSEIARRTGGIMSTTANVAQLPSEIVRMVELGSLISDARLISGVVFRVAGDNLEVRLDQAAQILTETMVVVLSRAKPGLVIAQGAVVFGGGRHWTVELRNELGTEVVKPGDVIQIPLP